MVVSRRNCVYGGGEEVCMFRRKTTRSWTERARRGLKTLGLVRPTRLEYILHHPFEFLRRVVAGFRNQQVLLLAGAVAYNTLLSLIPMLALILVGLSQLVESERLLAVTRETLMLLAPGLADTLVAEIRSFLGGWQVIGVVGVVALLFFSSLAFTSLENAMLVIFFHRAIKRRRHFLVSAIIPYLYILTLAMALLAITVLSSALHTLEGRSVTLWGETWSLTSTVRWTMYAIGIFSEVVLLTSLYLVMPVGQLALRHALVGGIVATLLWELTRHFLVWYFSTLSLVNVVYGTFAAAIMILLSLELAALILLFGAQVIAEYERIRP